MSVGELVPSLCFALARCVECVSELLAILAASGDEIICGPNISEDSESFTGVS